MKKFNLCLLTIISFLICIFTHAQNNWDSQKKIDRKNYQEITFEIQGFSSIDRFAMYPNGDQGIVEHIKKTLKYPKNAKKLLIEGIVIVEFLVDVDGKVKEIKVVKSIDPSIDKEAVRVISKMKRWIPTLQNGHYVKCLYQLPICFSIH